jgi:hypothetical protein
VISCPEGLFVGGFGRTPGIWRSRDGGSGWDRALSGQEIVQLAAFPWESGGLRIVAVGRATDGAWYVSWTSNGGELWHSLPYPGERRSWSIGGLAMLGNNLLLGTANGLWSYDLGDQ